MQKISVLTGPTACGKTAASIICARIIDAEIVSADSIQIYDRLDIGSAKPSVIEMDGVPHHMISCIPLGTEYSVSDYQRDAMKCIDDILSRNKRVIVVGGTGLYINSLTRDMDFAGAPKDQKFRQEWLIRESANPGSAHRALSDVDAASARKLSSNDLKRVIRALEVYHTTGKPMSACRESSRKAIPKYDSTIVALTMPRESLYNRIDRRVLKMIDAGLVNEVENILSDGYDPSAISLQGLGYKEVISALEGKCTLEQAIENIQRGTRRFAKRQLTWFRQNKDVHWIDVSAYDDIRNLAQDIVTQFLKTE